MSEVLTEILKVDPSFDKDRFLKQCEYDIIPNVLETYSQLAHPIQQAKAMGLQFHSRILDIDNIDGDTSGVLPDAAGRERLD
ncbi:hypothetical protein llap_19483 [Limosa lapponica baueri]|uniref:Uncharacterized protein n=1 Tax=Limosa lapponica baueri TaxID=1758121 RepID=A0A2I0T8T3_LIMLA|nr:hypothetical protein llap_19483 [Limosa lapponica baueri]